MRPGAGYLPTLALGRPRGRTTEPACADPGVPTVGPTAGGSRVTLLRPALRQAYRIYSEEEFLAAEDWQAEAEAGAGPESGAEFEPAYEFEPEFALLGEAGPRREPRQWGRLAALAALTSVVAAVVGVVALNVARSKSESDRRLAGRIAAGGGSLPEIVADRSSIRPLEARPRKHTQRASVTVRRATERRLRPVGRSPIPAHAHIPPPPTPPVATASAPTTTATSAIPTMAAASPTEATTGTSTTAGTSTTGTSTTGTPTTGTPTTGTPTTAAASTPVATTTTTAATSAAGGAGAEFGFERR